MRLSVDATTFEDIAKISPFFSSISCSRKDFTTVDTKSSPDLKTWVRTAKTCMKETNHLDVKRLNYNELEGS